MSRLLIIVLLVPTFSFSQDDKSGHIYTVVRIIDGDTVELLMDVATVKVRLIGVDTPETVHPQKPVEYYGKEASTFTRNLQPQSP